MFCLMTSMVSSVFFNQHEEKEFVTWMRRTNQIYTGEEYQMRFGIFMINKKFIQEHNSKNSFRLDLNEFSATTPSEYRSLLGFKMDMKRHDAIRSNFVPPESLDWREKGAVCDVKNQGTKCGSCWAFSTIAATEGAQFVAGNKLISLSEQNLVDCVNTCHGCNGGLMTNAFDYVIKYQAGRFNLETDYPYKAVQQNCAYDKSKAFAHVSKYINIVEGDEQDLESKCAQYGPVCVAIDADHFSFKFYREGIYKEEGCSSTSLDHGVTLVGYGSEDKVKYWIVKNSWGRGWGEKGFIRMLKDHDNHCGIATNACVPVA